MLEVDSGVDDGHVHIHAVVVATVDGDLRVGLRKDALDAGGDRLGADAALEILDHIGHARIALQVRQAPCRHDHGHALEGVLVNKAELQAQGLCHARRLPGRIHRALEHDDVPPGRAGRLGRDGGPAQ